MESEKWYNDSGDQIWFLIPSDTNIIHRLDGPAIVYEDGKEEWYYKGVKVECNSLEEFSRKIKLLAFL